MLITDAIKCGGCGELDLDNGLKKVGQRWLCAKCMPKPPSAEMTARRQETIKRLKARFASFLGDDIALLDEPDGLEQIKKKYGL